MSAISEMKVQARTVGDEQIVSLARLALDSAFQPIVETCTGGVFGYEALMRGFDRLGFDSPIALLDRAAAVQQLLPLEVMISSRAIAKFAALPSFETRTLFINFDPRLVVSGSWLIEELLRYLDRARIPASSICFEISERVDTSLIPELKAVVHMMQLAGFKIAIDDFGAGCNGLRALCDYNVDYVKIDRHFIAGIDQSPRRRQIVKHTLAMAHVLGIRVVAEGVETEAEFMTCRDLGCDLVQGYYIARPVTGRDQLQTVYPHVERAGLRRLASGTLDSMLIRRQIEHVEPVSENADLETVFDYFRANPSRRFFPVVNASGEPRGILSEQRLKALSYHPFGRDLMKNKVYQRGISHYVSKAPIVDIRMPAEQMLAMFADIDGAECVLLTENMRYAGILSASSLLKIINEKQLQMAQDQNPLTGLPGNRAIRDYLEDVALDGDGDRFLCYCDFDNFKPFNDAYGFQSGDLAITLFAGFMKRHFVGEDVFLGHIGGDDFFIGLKGVPRASALAALRHLLADFRSEVRQFYSAEDRARGMIEGHDRQGASRHFPLMRCSVAVLAIAEGALVPDVNLISNRIAVLKAQAKDSESGMAVDQFV
ncbi:diguanylate cyclase/phosphodiesterase [Rhizobium sp. RU20A]|uniref:EAL domain-containing protein n=1 Tax=Rhizobium sp. RU20A TaxID=1907412 RepID=UPI000955CA49|nr:EAL domain-containing protein [Rhizobium sp. RU20A]SIR17895.1 diguanylate cyclase/phosphodiesterase [Rhizobium sp. RU20A]